MHLRFVSESGPSLGPAALNLGEGNRFAPEKETVRVNGPDSKHRGANRSLSIDFNGLWIRSC